ncbi:MAG: hypothetical protein HXX20_15440 [Chloroflexi bacterium]|nr:hypothetical protein [Chloroflexota bacterium]
MTETEVVKLLRACKAMAERLTSYGINVILSSEEKVTLQNFSDLLLVYDNFKDLKPLADRAGLPLHELGMLRVRATMEYERRRGMAECPRCGCDRYEGSHHYLCQDQHSMLFFPNVSDEDMRTIIERVIEVEALASSRRPLLKRLPAIRAVG